MATIVKEGQDWSVSVLDRQFGGRETEVLKVDGKTGNVSVFSDLELDSGVQVGGVKVVSSQQAAIPDADVGTEVDTINAILVALRAHGLIAAQ